MAGKKLSPAELRETLRVLRAHDGAQKPAAAAMDIPLQTFRSRVTRALAWEANNRDAASAPFDPITLPDEELDVDELLAHRKKVFAQRHHAQTARKLIPVKVRLEGPIGICHFGDPHVDDDGCDISRLDADLKTTRTTEGLFGANLGDLQNAWVGRLARLWAEQSTSTSQAWKLVEWLVTSVDWLYIVAGNHDMWVGSGDPVKWMMKAQPGVYEAHGARLSLAFPNGKEVRVNARHDFTGHSMWNPAHGPMKAVQGGWRDHVLTCGHKHVSFVGGPLKDPSSGLLSWAIRCAGYKVWDRYALEKGLPDQNAFCACVTIIDPDYGDDDTRLITVVPNVQEAAEFLKWKRQRWARGRSR
jgi:hypothetical protein